MRKADNLIDCVYRTTKANPDRVWMTDAQELLGHSKHHLEIYLGIALGRRKFPYKCLPGRRLRGLERPMKKGCGVFCATKIKSKQERHLI